MTRGTLWAPRQKPSAVSNGRAWKRSGPSCRRSGHPVLVVHGAESRVLNREGAERLRDIFPDARLVASIAGAGHTVQGDRPKEFAGTVRSSSGESAIRVVCVDREACPSSRAALGMTGKPHGLHKPL